MALALNGSSAMAMFGMVLFCRSCARHRGTMTLRASVCGCCGRAIEPGESSGRLCGAVLHVQCWVTARANARTAASVAVEQRDVLVIARWQRGLYELIRHCATPTFEIRLDERQGERPAPRPRMPGRHLSGFSGAEMDAPVRQSGSSSLRCQW